MAELEVGAKVIGPNSGEIYEVLAVHTSPSNVRSYWAIGDGDSSPTSWNRELEGWKKAPDFFEEGATYKSPYGTIALVRYVEEIGSKKHAFAHTVDTDGAHSGTVLHETHYEYWKKQ